MDVPLRVLIVDDSEDDVKLLVRELRRGGYDEIVKRVDSAVSLQAALEVSKWDVIISDYTMPGFSGTEALRVVRGMELGIPVILVSGTIDQDVAVALMKEGADDFLLKDRLAGLVPAIKRSMEVYDARRTRNLAQDALRENEEHLRAIIRATQDAMVVINNVGLIVTFNSAAERMFGLQAEDVLGQSVNCLMPESYRSQHTRDVASFFSSGKPDGVIGKTVEVPGIRANGEEFIAEVSLAAGGDGDRAFAVGIVRDITNRRLADKALRESQEEYQDLYDNAPTGYHEIDRDGRIVRVNRTEATLLGYEPEEMLGRCVYEFAAVPEMDKAREAIRKKIAGERPLKPFERRYVTKDGEEIHVAIRDKLVFDEVGDVIGIRSTVQDVTARIHAERELRESESRFKELFNNMSSGVAVYEVLDDGNDFVFKDINAVGERISEVKRDDVCGKRILEIFPNAREFGLLDVMQRVWKTGKTECLPASLYKDDRVSHWVENNVYRLPSGEIVAVYDDMSESKKLEEQLRQSQKMEAIGQLAGGVAHDFNNLLMVINSYSAFLLKSLDSDSPMREDVEEIRAAGERAASLTRQLLAFSRKQVLQPKILDLNSAVAEMDKMLQRLIGEDIDLATVTDPNLALVEVDPGQIEQVVMNLAVNARDAMPGGGKFTIETANVELSRDYANRHAEVTAGPYVMLAMSDTGTGMDAETRLHIFDPFFTTKEQGKGTGLGLSTVYGIVKQSHGHISVYSELGHGTTFKVYLPQAEGLPCETSSTPSIDAECGSETILLVEDEFAVRKLIAKALKKAGYTVLSASNGEEALQLYRQQKDFIDLVLTDMVMPKMGGIELIQQLRALTPNLRWIFMSGYTDRAMAHNGLLDTNENFVSKPLTPDMLIHKLREVLDAPGSDTEAPAPARDE